MDRKRAAPGGVIIAEATLHRWAEGGKKEVRSKLVQAIQDGSHRDSGRSDDTLHRLLYELIWVAVNAKLPRQDVISLLKEADVASKSSASDTLTDLLWVIGNEVEANERGRERHSSTEWQNLCRLVKGVADEEIVSLLHLKSALEFDVLIGAGLMAGEPQALSRKVVRVNTKTLYLQVKYNLLREETEGFSKVLALLHSGVTKDQLATTKTDLLALIGYFDLDANRVLDLVLDAYEKHTTNDAFVDLLGSFKRESLPHVVGFKFQFYKRETGANDVGVSGGRVTPRSLYRLAATLIKKKLLTLDEIMPHLSPSRLEIVDESKKRIIELQQAARAFGKINLAAKTDDKDEEKDKADAGSDGGDVNNQIYGLIIGLLEIGARDMAFEMIDWFQKQGANPFMYKPLTLQLCSLVHALIADLYAPLSYASMGFARGAAVNGAEVSSALKYISPLSTLEECVKTVFPIVELMGPYLHHDELLLIKLVRISNHMVEQNNKQPVLATSDELMTVLKSLTVKAFLPSLSLQACNPSASYHIWDLVKVFPFDERYRMYLQWLGAYANHPELRLVEAQVVQNTRGVMRRLTADRAKASSRHLTHFAHSNPLIVFRTMLRQIQSYDNLIQPVVESFKFITPLGMDALSFILVSELSKPQKSMKADGTNVSLWLQSLANFSGSFYRKYPNVELEGLLQYLIKRLENWASVDLIVLSELLSKMGSCISLEDISVNQLEAQAGGPHLWHEPPTDPKLQNRRAIPLLRDALIKRNLALPLCILICQMRSKIEYQEDKALPHLKLLGRVYDTCQMTLTQLLQFMNGVVDPVVYKDMLPRLNALVHDYHVPAELAMTLCRPAIRCDDPVLRRAPRGINAPASKKAEQSSTEDAAWYMYSSKLLDDVGTALRSDNRDPFVGMTREMYVTFWSLTLYDIHIPFPQYEAEILRLRNSISGAAANNANLSSSERKKLKEKTMQQIDKLTNEQKDQVTHRKRVFERLEDAKSKFFVKEAAARQTAINELLQTCVVPRALLSPEDALFAAKFMERLHVMRTPVFSLLQYMHKVNMKLPPIVLCSTEREAGNFGIFLKETLLLVHRWYQSSGTYDEEAAHGFSTDLADPENPAKCLSFKQYKTTYVRWHRAAEKVYGTTLSSGEYMQIRNSLVVLTKIIDVFPSGKGAAEVLLDIVRPLTEEDREDIKIMAKRYFALLTKRKGALVDDKSLSARASRAFLKTVTDRVAPNERDDAAKRKDAGTDEEALGEDRTEPVKARAGRTDDGSPSRGDELESGEIASYDSPPRPASNGRDSEHARDRRRESDRGNRGGSRERERDRGRERSRSHDRERNERGGRTDRSGSAENRDRRDGDDERWSSRRREEHREASPGLSRETSDGSASGPRRDRQRDNAGRPHNRDGRDARGSGGGGRSSRERNDRPSDREGNPARSRGANGGGTPNENGARDRDGGPEGGASTGSEARKRPRVDADEAALRRQLTEKMKMDQQQRERTRDPTADTPPEDKQSQSPAPSGNQRKIVSLVSRKREREVGRPATPQGDTRDEGNSTGDSQAPETKRRRDDDKRNKGGRHNQKPKADNAGGGGGNSQSRDQMRRQERANVNRSNDRRPADDQQRGGNGGSNRRRDNGNDQRGRRR